MNHPYCNGIGRYPRGWWWWWWWWWLHKHGSYHFFSGLRSELVLGILPRYDIFRRHQINVMMQYALVERMNCQE
ncbi:hypothetical protein K449DRAFT_167904 [Hypoxylon sp. EC38]|nr:hypothetical protein K449DRAFT_167904 [Hypoxylon sp. EC38]